MTLRNLVIKHAGYNKHGEPNVWKFCGDLGLSRNVVYRHLKGGHQEKVYVRFYKLLEKPGNYEYLTVKS